ncbi:unnamed protein product [Acanthoscelides obtectus]|nr:unnamed protein product [Acanthoscelides obtectus]CAK1648503.1 hypothetical protein AOBTE_LOCUS15732 [Acanthoscelides obtectus]
MPVQAP